MGGAPSSPPGAAPAGTSLEVQLNPQPDIPRGAVEPLLAVELIVEGVQRPRLLGERVLAVSVSKPRFHAPQHQAIDRAGLVGRPGATGRSQIDGTTGQRL